MTLQARIEEKLRAALGPTVLEVENESHMHSVPKGSETHFKVVVVSKVFEGKTSVARHQLVYRALEEELRPKSGGGAGLHALAITSRTPEEWAASPVANASPLCAGGSKGDNGPPRGE
jgi:BolA protein